MIPLLSVLAHLGLGLTQSIAIAVAFFVFLGLHLIWKYPFARAAAIAWTVVMLIGLLSPSSGMPNVGSNDKVIHALIFAGFSLLWRLATLPDRQTISWGVAFAIVTELLQSVLPIKRSGDWQDALADIVGLLIGVLLARVVMMIRRPS